MWDRKWTFTSRSRLLTTWACPTNCHNVVHKGKTNKFSSLLCLTQRNDRSKNWHTKFNFRLSVIVCKLIGHFITNCYLTGGGWWSNLTVDMQSEGTLFEYQLARLRAILIKAFVVLLSPSDECQSNWNKTQVPVKHLPIYRRTFILLLWDTNFVVK
jgi:hypothetical protein